jgi:hypothetical protein
MERLAQDQKRLSLQPDSFLLSTPSTHISNGGNCIGVWHCCRFDTLGSHWSLPVSVANCIVALLLVNVGHTFADYHRENLTSTRPS